MSKTKRTVLLVTLGVIAAIILGVLAWTFFWTPSYPTGNDSYLSYQKVTDGPVFSFGSDVTGAFSDYDYNARYIHDESSPTYYYHYLQDALPQKILILNEVTGQSVLLMSEEQYLLYNPETVEDPLRLLSPCQATLSLSEGTETKNSPKMTVTFDEKSYLDAFWHTLLETQPVEGSFLGQGVPIESLKVRGSLHLYLDTSKLVYLSLTLGQTASGEWVWQVRAYKNEGESERWYYLPCTGAFRETIESYIAFLRDGESVPPETTPAPCIIK